MEIEKSQILSDNKGKISIYMWIHLESGRRYVGSTLDSSIRLLKYYFLNHLDRNKNMYICRALKDHGYAAFFLSILEYIDITNLSKEQAKELVLLREQYYFNTLNPEFNLLKIAGSFIEFKHTEASKAKLSEAMKGDNYHQRMLGRNHSIETKTKISIANKGKLLNIPRTEETKAKSSATQGTAIYIYLEDRVILINKLPLAVKAAEFLKSSHHTVLKYAKNGKLFKKQWILFTTLK